MFLEQLARELHACELVASSLHQQIENLAFIVNRPPEPELLAANEGTAISSRCHRTVGRPRAWRRGNQDHVTEASAEIAQGAALPRWRIAEPCTTRAAFKNQEL
jgi:hypothetical protein